MIHKFKNNNYNFVLDVESGTILELDDLAYDLLGEKDLISPEDLNSELKENYSDEEILETYNELKSLKDNDLLYSQSLEEIPEFNKNINVKALCLHVAHDCNLRCSYCFAGQGDFKGERSLMSLETAKKAIDFVIEASKDRTNIEIDFFGGEPLMNYDVVQKTVEYARSKGAQARKNFHFTITTNGLLLTPEKRKWLNENMDNIVLSHDGRKEVNDHMRTTVNGKGSYDVITDNIIDMALERDGDKDYYVRGTYTSNNLDFLEDIKHFVDKGIKNISVEPVVAHKEDSYAILEEHVPELIEEYNKLAAYNLENDFNFFHFNINLDKGPCLYKRLSGCGAGTDYLAITPEGKIFPCHQFVSEEEFCLGDLDTGIVNAYIQEDFKDSDVTKKEKCLDCWCKYFCGGGCFANAYNFNENLNEPYEIACDLEKARIEAAIMLHSKKNSD